MKPTKKIRDENKNLTRVLPEIRFDFSESDEGPEDTLEQKTLIWSVQSRYPQARKDEPKMRNWHRTSSNFGGPTAKLIRDERLERQRVDKQRLRLLIQNEEQAKLIDNLLSENELLQKRNDCLEENTDSLFSNFCYWPI